MFLVINSIGSLVLNSLLIRAKNFCAWLRIWVPVRVGILSSILSQSFPNFLRPKAIKIMETYNQQKVHVPVWSIFQQLPCCCSLVRSFRFPILATLKIKLGTIFLSGRSSSSAKWFLLNLRVLFLSSISSSAFLSSICILSTLGQNRKRW